MLCLKLHRGERIYIGPDVFITLPEGDSRETRIAFSVPGDVNVVRTPEHIPPRFRDRAETTHNHDHDTPLVLLGQGTSGLMAKIDEFDGDPGFLPG